VSGGAWSSDDHVVKPTRIVPDIENLDATEFAFELPLAVVAKTFEEAGEKHKGAWGIVEIGYYTSEKVGQRVAYTDSGSSVHDEMKHRAIAIGTFAIKLR
jgi:hypothetical protein